MKTTADEILFLLMFILMIFAAVICSSCSCVAILGGTCTQPCKETQSGRGPVGSGNGLGNDGVGFFKTSPPVSPYSDNCNSRPGCVVLRGGRLSEAYQTEIAHPSETDRSTLDETALLGGPGCQ